MFQKRQIDNQPLSHSTLMLLLVLGISLCFVAGCDNDKNARIDIDFRQLDSPRPNGDLDLERIAAEVNHFCGDCHAPPPPTAIPKDGWFAEIKLMFELYESSGRNDLKVPKKGEVVEYYRTLAPDKIEMPSPLAVDTDHQLPLERTNYKILDRYSNLTVSDPPAFSNLTWYDSTETELLDKSILLACEMRTGLVVELTFDGQKIAQGRHAILNNPSHSTLSDLDQDGIADFLIADLGSFLPSDHEKGSVAWLRRATNDTFSVELLLENVGRVTDIQVGDFNGDGQSDLIVAEFGWRNTGNVWLLTQTALVNGVPKFSKQRIDDRHGVIHIPTIDINQDGHLDFVSVISQEHEAVELFVNRGDGTFRRQNLFEANSPVWGSTGIDLTDFDNDGDVDILYTNGDIFDTFYIVPYHSAHLIENLGEGKWGHRTLGNLPGIHRAIAGDLDDDGDQDVVCCSLISRPLDGVSIEDLDSVIWLEQTGEGDFIPRSLEKGNCNHATIVVDDFDHDGDLDIATAQFEDTRLSKYSDIAIWWNNSIIPSQESTKNNP